MLFFSLFSLLSHPISASFREPVSKLRHGRQIEMGVSGEQVSVHVDTFPFSFPVRLHRHTGIAAVCAVPVMEFMPSDFLTGSEISLTFCTDTFRIFCFFFPELPQCSHTRTAPVCLSGMSALVSLPPWDMYCRFHLPSPHADT